MTEEEIEQLVSDISKAIAEAGYEVNGVTFVADGEFAPIYDWSLRHARIDFKFRLELRKRGFDWVGEMVQQVPHAYRLAVMKKQAASPSA